MYVSTIKLAIIRKILVALYTSAFDEGLILRVAHDLGMALEAHYFGFFLFSHARCDHPIFLTNNPAEFIPVYTSVVQEDFLTKSIVHSGTSCVLKRMSDFNQPENRNFIRAVQDSRPISDVAYFPIRTGATLRGYIALARAGLRNRDFSDDDLDVFWFVASFLNDAFERSLVLPPSDEDTGYLDYAGNIVYAGDHVKTAFDELFGVTRARLGSAMHHRWSQFLTSYSTYLYGPFRLGMDTVRLEKSGREYSFRFSPVKPGSLYIEQKGVPCAAVRLLPMKQARIDGAQLELCQGNYAFTPREREVIRGILQCKSNKAIACDLRVEETTIKRYTHNIYEKTGLKTRVELVLGLPASEKDQL